MFQSIFIAALIVLGTIAQAAVPDDAIQRCLDIRRLVDFTSQQKMISKAPGIMHFGFHPISAAELPLENPVGQMDEVIRALEHQIENCNKHHGELQTIQIADRLLQRQEWCLQTNQKMLALAKAAHGDFNRYISTIKTEFDWYKSDGWPEHHAGFKQGDVQFTAYYAPAAIEARTQRGGAFLYPIYSNPGVVSVVSESKRLNRKSPLCGVDPLTKRARGFCLKQADGTYSVVPDRNEIDQGALNKKYVIGYVKDPNDPSFLMLQGSGSLRLNGTLFHINYDGSNGRPRTMLGRIVQCAQDPTCGGNLDAMERCAKDPKCHDEAMLHCHLSKHIQQSGGSEQLIRQYLDDPRHRDSARDLRGRDQSVVFFVKEQGGPYGSENIPLTPHASCATEHKIIPVGMIFLYHTRQSLSWCVAQDSGGAIVGAHVDCYKGEGMQAGKEANDLNHSGSLFVALPKRK
jgi:membrane-bound lytic murein transglycosylase